MSRSVKERARDFWRAPLLSPTGFLRIALWIALAFALAHLAGIRENTRMLSGTQPPGEGSDPIAAAVLGVIYTLAYFAFVIAAPIFVGAAGLLAIAEKAFGPRPPR